MLLALDIGNSSISMGVFSLQNGELLHTFKLTADTFKSADEYLVQICSMLYFNNIDKSNIASAIISSVVPTLTHSVTEAVKQIVSNEIKLVGPGLKTGFPIRIDNPSELGSDFVANTVAALELSKQNKNAVFIVDLGTATTISAINSNGEYVGNSILPGIKLSLDAIYNQTALIPVITPSIPKSAIGKNSTASVRSGVVLGNIFMIDAFIEEFRKELYINKDAYSVYITGGFAELLIPHLKHSVIYEPHLTLKGLYYLYKANAK